MVRYITEVRQISYNERPAVWRVLMCCVKRPSPLLELDPSHSEELSL